jgi:hypothetical protein
MRCEKCKREMSDGEPVWRLWRSFSLCAGCKPDAYFREPQPCARCGRPVHEHDITRQRLLRHALSGVAASARPSEAIARRGHHQDLSRTGGLSTYRIRISSIMPADDQSSFAVASKSFWKTDMSPCPSQRQPKNAIFCASASSSTRPSSAFPRISESRSFASEIALRRRGSVSV